jgi:hypothetical protein
MNGDELNQFIRDILAEKQLSGVDESVREQLVVDMKQRMLDQINRALIEALPDEKIDEFSAMLDDPEASDQIVQDFMMRSGVDVKRVTLQAMLTFRDLYLGNEGKAAE